MKNKSIFISSLWRSSSTYFLDKFRLDNTICYCEPFHEQIIDIIGNRQRYSELDFYREKLTLGHSSTTKNYFEEYNQLNEQEKEQLTLLKFNPFAEYFNYERIDNQENYISTLYNSLFSLNKIPVFGFVRNLGILPELLNRLRENLQIDIFSILLIRNPQDVFTSFYEQVEKWDNYYFLSSMINILINSEYQFTNNSKIIQQLKEQYQLSENDYEKTIKSFSVEQLYTLFCWFYLLSYTRGLMSNSYVVLIEKVADDLNYQQYLSNLIKTQCNLNINFEDCQLPEKTNYPLSEIISQQIFYQVAREIAEISLDQQFSQGLFNLISLLEKPYARMSVNQDQDLSYYLKNLPQINTNLVNLSKTTVEILNYVNHTDDAIHNRFELNLHELNQAKAETHQAKTDLHLTNVKLAEIVGQLDQTQAQLQQTQAQLQQTQVELQQTQAQLQQTQVESQAIIQGMESSKFWKLRNLWFKIKKKLTNSQ